MAHEDRGSIGLGDTDHALACRNASDHSAVTSSDRTVAVVNSTFHVALLLENLGAVDTLLCMHDGLLRHRERFEEKLGARVLELPTEQFSMRKAAAITRLRKRNHELYQSVEALLDDLAPRRLILFVEGKPISRFLCDYAIERRIACELWEDGLNHYVDFFDGPLTYAKQLTKLAAGYYRPGLFARRLPREQLLVRDRFVQANIRLSSRGEPDRLLERVLFIGQPLVEDRLVSERRYQRCIGELHRHAGVPLDYLVHPRESRKRIGDLGINIIGEHASAEEYCGANDYLAFVSAFSTSNLNIGRFHKNYYLPGPFGLRRVADKLEAASVVPVQVVSSMDQVRLSRE
jgi:hypothetical protein